MAVRMVAVVQCKENLHKIVPDGVFRDRSIVALGLFDYNREIATATVFHKNVENTSFTVDVAVVISNNMFMVEVFQDVSGGLTRLSLPRT